MKKKRKFFRTPEERAAWEAEGERLQKALRERIAMIEAELERKRQRPAAG